MSASTIASVFARATAAVWCAIISSVTGTVESKPMKVLPSESPTRIMSAPAASARRANRAS